MPYFHDQPDPDDLLTLTTTDTEFQAGLLVAVLKDAGIDAFSFGAVAAMEPYGKRLMPVVIQVRKADMERARAALQQNIADSIDIDWDEVDVGEPDDAVDESYRGRVRMPLVPRLGFYAALLAILIMFVLALLVWRRPTI